MKANVCETKKMKGKGYYSQKIKSGLFIFSIMFIPLTIWSVFFFGVNFKSILFSFQKIDIYGNVSYVGLVNYSDFLGSIFGDGSLVIKSLLNSIKWWGINVIISTPLYMAFAYYVFLNFRGSKFFRICAMIPTMISGLIFSLLFQKTLSTSVSFVLTSSGHESINFFTDPDWALPVNIFYCLWSGMTSALIIIPNAMKNATPEIIEASEIDGANVYTKFWYIVLPAMMPAQIATWITGIAGLFMASYNLITFYMYDAPESLWTLGYYFTVKVMTSSNQVDYPAMASAGFCPTIFASVVTLVSKHFLLKWQEHFE